MSWEERNGKRYYYRKARVNGRVVSEYVGAGPVAELAARLDELDAQRRQFEQDDRRRELLTLAELDRPIEEFSALVNHIVEAVLLATGHHKHKRQWRKRRMTEKKVATVDSSLEAAGVIFSFELSLSAIGCLIVPFSVGSVDTVDTCPI